MVHEVHQTPRAGSQLLWLSALCSEHWGTTIIDFFYVLFCIYFCIPLSHFLSSCKNFGNYRLLIEAPRKHSYFCLNTGTFHAHIPWPAPALFTFISGSREKCYLSLFPEFIFLFESNQLLLISVILSQICLVLNLGSLEIRVSAVRVWVPRWGWCWMRLQCCMWWRNCTTAECSVCWLCLNSTAKNSVYGLSKNARGYFGSLESYTKILRWSSLTYHVPWCWGCERSASAVAVVRQRSLGFAVGPCPFVSVGDWEGRGCVTFMSISWQFPPAAGAAGRTGTRLWRGSAGRGRRVSLRRAVQPHHAVRMRRASLRKEERGSGNAMSHKLLYGCFLGCWNKAQSFWRKYLLSHRWQSRASDFPKSLRGLWDSL